jgi:hypothetical protein
MKRLKRKMGGRQPSKKNPAKQIFYEKFLLSGTFLHQDFDVKIYHKTTVLSTVS